MTTDSARSRLPLRKRLAFAGVAALLVYAAAEAVASAVWTRVVPSVYWVFEGASPDVRFDPVSGYRVHGGPVRVAKFVRSRNPFAADCEYVGGVAGNAQGFPDRDDFAPERRVPGATRLIVLGDSFSGGDLLRPWADACEDSVAARGGSADLLNFSLSGIGLANWHSMLTREIEPRGYDADGVVFAVWGNDLARRFYACDSDGASRRLGGRAASWDPDRLPRTADEARSTMGSWQGYPAAPIDFEASLRGAWKPVRPFAPVIAGTVLDRLRGTPQGTGAVGAAAPGTLAAELADTSAGRGRLVREIRESLARIGRPATVVWIPSIEDLVAHREGESRPDAVAFADAIGAQFRDGTEAFAGLDEAAVRALWYPVDLHWNQQGSDRFAAWMADAVLAWPVQAGAVRADRTSRDGRTGAR